MRLKIEEIIEEKGLKKIHVARKVGVDPNTVSRWINKGGNMTLINAIKLAKALDVKLEDLYEE